MFGGMRKATQLIDAGNTLPGRQVALPVPDAHFVHGRRLEPPFPQGQLCVQFGMGCFWGAERIFWQIPGVYTTAVGYSGGETPHPNYEEVCTGLTNHAETVLVVFDPLQVAFEELLRAFWEGHDPTQGMRQGNDIGTQYRSVIFTYGEDEARHATASRERYGEVVRRAGFGRITTEIRAAPKFYYAEDYHQQYLAKNPGGYCGLGGTGIACPQGIAT